MGEAQPGQHYFVSVMAPDRPGLIGHIGRRVEQLGGVIADLSQTVMREFFTVILYGRFPAKVSPGDIEASLLDGMSDLIVGVKPDAGDSPTQRPGQRFILTARGHDRPGIVGDLGTFFAGRDINVDDMYARLEPGPPVQMVMILQLNCPECLDMRQLQLDLAELSDELGIDLHLQHENVFLAMNEVSAVRALTL